MRERVFRKLIVFSIPFLVTFYVTFWGNKIFDLSPFLPSEDVADAVKEIPFFQNGEADVQDLPPKIVTNDRRPCRVIISNKADYHHEVLESVVLRYPLPWDDFNCSAYEKPIVYDFSLLQNRWTTSTSHIWYAAVTGQVSKFLNQTEFWTWKNYFERNLQNRTFPRIDGKTRARFGRLISYKEFGEYDAVIDASCDSWDYLPFLRRNQNFHCVLHGTCDSCTEQDLRRCCFLSPMWPQDQCRFIAADLPKFDPQQLAVEDPSETRICVIGAHAQHDMLAELFSKVPYKKYNAGFFIGDRMHKERDSYYRYGIDKAHLNFVHGEKDYKKFANFIAKCSIILPGKDPLEHPEYYGITNKKVSGSIGQIVGYKIPSVMHEKMYNIYHEYFTAPVETYTDTLDSKVEALTRMIIQVAEKA